MTRTDQRQESFERHAQTVVQVVISGLLVWVGLTTVDMVKSVSELKVKVEERSAQYTRDISELKSEVSALKVQVTTASLAAATAATAAAVAATKR